MKRVKEKRSRKIPARLSYSDLIKMRLESNITQEELAKFLNINQSTVSKVQQGKLALTTQQFFHVCSFFKIDPVKTFWSLGVPNG